MKPLRIGTRRSQLAIAQAEIVRAGLVADGATAEIVPLTTSGDRDAVAAASTQGMKGLWIDAIMDALELGHIDVAVHSAKDLPAEDEAGSVIAAVPLRADPFDVLITRERALPPEAVIGTSSLRRRAQLLASFPGLKVTDLHGNVETRLRKLAEGEVDAVVLAAAGLARLGIRAMHAQTMSLEQMVPAPGQGCLAVQCRDDDDATLRSLGLLDHPPSHLALDVERSLMWRVGGGCALPLGAYARIVPGGGVRLTALIASPEGDRVIRVEEEHADGEAVAGTVAQALIAQGAEEILAEVQGT